MANIPVEVEKLEKNRLLFREKISRLVNHRVETLAQPGFGDVYNGIFSCQI